MIRLVKLVDVDNVVEIYHKVMEKIKKEKVGSKTKDRKSVRDWVEDNLNISL